MSVDMMLKRVDNQWVAGLIGAQVALFNNPLEIAKTKLHLLGEGGISFNASKGTMWSNSSVGKIGSIWKTEGFKVLTKGAPPSALFYAISNVASIQTLKYVELLGIEKPRRNEDYAFKSSFQLASVIGLNAVVLPSPLYLVKTRIQANSNEGVKTGYQHLVSQNGVVGLLRNVYHTEVGPRGLFRAALSNQIRFSVLTSAAIYSYTRIRPMAEEAKVCSEEWIPMVSAVAAASTGAFIAAPLDLISTRLYNQGVSRYGGSMHYKHFLDCLLKVASKEGLLRLYRHSIPTTLTLSLHSGVALYLWDHFGLLYQN